MTAILRNVSKTFTFEEQRIEINEIALDLYNLQLGTLELTDFSVTTGSVVSGGALSYDNTTGVFTYNPPDLSAFLTSFTETDPIFTASVAANITSQDITNWNNAHSWGDHSLEGYLKAVDQVNSDWNATSGLAEILNKPVLFSGSYNDLTDTPTLFSGNYNDLSNLPVLFSGSYNDLTDKPVLFSGSYDDLTDTPTIPTIPTNVSAFTNDVGYITSFTDTNTEYSLNSSNENVNDVKITLVGNNSTTDNIVITQGSNISFSNVTTGGFTISATGGGGSQTLDQVLATGNTTTRDIDTTGKILYSNNYANLAALPLASTYHGMFAHVHSEGHGYYAHAGAWVQLLDTSSSIGELGNVNLSVAPTNGQVLKWNSSANAWQPATDLTASGGGVTDLEDLNDVVYTGTQEGSGPLTTGEVLYYNGSNWTNNTLSIPDNVSDLSDVSNATPSDGEALLWDDTNNLWVPGAVSGGGGGGLNNIVEDTTPQLGGKLDCQTNNIDFYSGGACFGGDSSSYGARMFIHHTNNVNGSTSFIDDASANGLYLMYGTSNGKVVVKNRTGNTQLTINDSGVQPVKILDALGSAGTAGQILSSTGTSLDWIDAPSGGGGNTYSLAALLSPGVELLENGSAVAANRVFFDGGTGITITRTNTNPHTIQFDASLNLNDLGNVNVGSPTDGHVLKWQNSTQTWIAAADLTATGGSGIALTDLSRTNASPAATSKLEYDNTTGVFTYTPPDLSSYLSAESDTLDTVLGRGGSSTKVLTAGGDGSSSGVTLSDGEVSIRAGSGQQAKINLFCAVNNAHYVTVKAPPHANFSGNVDFVLPANNGTNGYVLSTDGNGTTSWVAQSGGSSPTFTYEAAIQGASNVQLQLKKDGSVIDSVIMESSTNVSFNNISSGGFQILASLPSHTLNDHSDVFINTSTLSSGQVLTWDGSQWTNSATSSYTDSDVNAHLNVVNASSGQILSWNGSDYVWVADQTGSGGGGSDKIEEGNTRAEVVDDSTVNNNGHFLVATDAIERFRITHNGNILGGKASIGNGNQDPVSASGNVGSGIKLVGATASEEYGGFGMSVNAKDIVAIFNRTNTTGRIVEFKYNGSSIVGAIEVDALGKFLLRANSSEGLFYVNGGERIRIGDTGQIGLSGANYGTAGQVLTSGGPNNAPTWSTVSGGGGGGSSVAGSNKQIQFNDNGSLAGGDGLEFTKYSGSGGFPDSILTLKPASTQSDTYGGGFIAAQTKNISNSIPFPHNRAALSADGALELFRTRVVSPTGGPHIDFSSQLGDGNPTGTTQAEDMDARIQMDYAISSLSGGSIQTSSDDYSAISFQTGGKGYPGNGNNNGGVKERLRIGRYGEIGIDAGNISTGSVNNTRTDAEKYGTNGQVLTSGGKGSSVYWSTVSSGGGTTDKIEENNTRAEVVDTNGSNGYFKVDISGTEKFRVTNNGEALLKTTGTSMEGGHLQFENVNGSVSYAIDVYRNNAGADDVLRFIDQSLNLERFSVGPDGEWGIGHINRSFGTAGQVFTSQGPGSAPTWSTVSGGGGSGATTSFVQRSSDATTNSTSFQTVLTVTITPSSSSSSVLITASGAFGGWFYPDNDDPEMAVPIVHLFRGSSAIGQAMIGHSRFDGSNGSGYMYNGLSLSCKDSPGTTGTVTYHLKLRRWENSESQNVRVQQGTSLILQEVS